MEIVKVAPASTRSILTSGFAELERSRVVALHVPTRGSSSLLLGPVPSPEQPPKGITNNRIIRAEKAAERGGVRFFM
jgi:hypothetical protein